MNKETIYWTMKDGQKIDVDTMSDQHVRNAFKMVLRNIEKAETELRAKSAHSRAITLNGEMAQLWNDSNEEHDFMDDLDLWDCM